MEVERKAALAGGNKVDSLIGIGIIIYLVAMSMQTLIFSLRYSVYSLCAAGVLAVGELPFLFSCGPLALVATWLTPMVKALTYGIVSLGGIGCFMYVSWSPLLLTGHLLIGFLSWRCFMAANVGFGGGYQYDKVDMDEI